MRLVLAALLVLMPLVLGGCGKKGPPRPPVRTPTPAASPLATPAPAVSPTP